MQNGIDSRFSAIYGNPYLRSTSSILPPLPPPATANPSATPAPPPYQRHHVNSNTMIAGNMRNLNTTNSIIGNITGSVSGSSSNLTGSSNTLAATPLAQPTTSSSILTNSSTKTGQFILSANGSAKKGALATHV